ncbi:chemotaxis protein CheA [Zhongshania aliphaticivorans]|uniref:chemotaxis protein CheA n=1 Tax=Zhongshania aliphaticivorans TaxID=1470434 RepID=UPI0012E5538D|nr:chemotaxis protein CheA [Zhongshania aliphaticivorans]CAA0107767.1 Chemotaxis protein CheA [Zhongshania aliphaticivorans]
MSDDMDMSEIHDIFYEESYEGLDVMESGLLGLGIGQPDLEIVNNIFRAAHSIKGGAATFGFLPISKFTHGVETLLDQIRAQERSVSEDVIEVLLESVDSIRCMLDMFKAGNTPDEASSIELKQRIDTILALPSGVAMISASDGEVSELAETKQWTIQFFPSVDILKTGNEPLRIFNELRALGELKIVSDISKLPDIRNMEADSCYTHWILILDTDAERKRIEEVFDWVSDQADIIIECKESGIANSQAQAAPVAAALGLPSSEAESGVTAGVSSSNGKKTSSTKESGSIRVSIDKIDALLNLVGELVITQSMLARHADGAVAGNEAQGLKDGLLVLERHTRELQESAMQIRMLPIGASFSRFKRLVRDLSQKTGKKVELKLSGENTELDKTVLEKMSDPLVHLVRNSLDHGIEKPEDRLAAGKPETGTLHLSAYHEGGNIVIQVDDDGAGLNRQRILAKAIEKGIVSPSEQLSDDQINNLIFQAGFSTAEAVSDLSGRGVGMDVVRRNINDLGGRIEVSSREGVGSRFKIRLPLTLAILDGQLVKLGSDVYIFSLLSIVETVLVSPGEVRKVVGNGNVYRLRDDYIPVVRLRDAFKLRCNDSIKTYLERDGELLVVVESDGQRIGLFVDELLDQQQVVIKSLEENYKPVAGLAGATILGDGNVAMIIDVPSLIKTLDIAAITSKIEDFAA